MVEQRPEEPCVASSILALGTDEIQKKRSVAQLARASGLGPEGRRFKSFHSDHLWKFIRTVHMQILINFIDRHRFFLIIIPAILFQLVGSLFYFIIIKNPEIAKTIYTTLKTVMILWPIIFVIWLKKIPLVKKAQKPNHIRSLLYGTILGGIILGVTWLLSDKLIHELSFAVPLLKERAGKFGIIDHYLFFAVSLSTANALFEEYYWRWFIMRSLSTKFSITSSIIVTSLGFTAHHLVVLSQFVPWLGVFILGSCVFVGGLLFSLIYNKTNSIVGSIVCHFLADSAILFLGYKLLF